MVTTEASKPLAISTLIAHSWQEYAETMAGPSRLRSRRDHDGSVALGVGMIEADLSGEVVDPLSYVVASDVGVRRVSVPARGDRGRHPLVPAIQPVLPRR
jgi:hypothetical protein